jgi:hypothetical protein
MQRKAAKLNKVIETKGYQTMSEIEESFADKNPRPSMPVYNKQLLTNPGFDFKTMKPVPPSPPTKSDGGNVPDNQPIS